MDKVVVKCSNCDRRFHEPANNYPVLTTDPSRMVLQSLPNLLSFHNRIHLRIRQQTPASNTLCSIFDHLGKGNCLDSAHDFALSSPCCRRRVSEVQQAVCVAPSCYTDVMHPQNHHVGLADFLLLVTKILASFSS